MYIFINYFVVIQGLVKEVIVLDYYYIFFCFLKMCMEVINFILANESMEIFDVIFLEFWDRTDVLEIYRQSDSDVDV